MRSKYLSLIAIPIVAVVTATITRYVCNPLLGLRSPLLFHILAVAIVAHIAGTISGLIATALSAVAIDYFFVAPFHTLAPSADFGDNMALLLFVGVGGVLSIFGGGQKRWKDELVEARYVLETAQHIASIGSWDSNLVTNTIRWSPNTSRILGFPAGTVANRQDFYECIPPEERDTVRAAVAKAIETDSEYDFEHHIVRKSDGELRQVHHQAMVVKNRYSLHLVGSIKDITEEKRGEVAQQILSGLLQVCSACRRIQADNEWFSMEAYMRLHSTAKFSHGMCPDCSKQWYSEGHNGDGHNGSRPIVRQS